MSRFLIMAVLVPAIHVFLARGLKDVDARHEAGHDGEFAPFPPQPSQPTFTCGTDHCDTAIGSSTGLPRNGADRQ